MVWILSSYTDFKYPRSIWTEIECWIASN